MTRCITLFIGLGLWASSVLAQDSVENWQKKAVADFPEIGVKGSQMNVKYLRKIETLRTSNPAFFKDARWPYTVAEQIAKPSVIPGLENVAIPGQPSPRIPPPEPGGTPKTHFIHGMGRVEVIPASDLATKATVGTVVCTQGVITKSFVPSLAGEGKFYVQLRPDVICEFATASFFDLSRSGLESLGRHSFGERKLKFEDGGIFVYGPRSSRFEDNKSSVKIGQILKPGETVSICGKFDGKGAVGLLKGLMLRECYLVSPQ